MNLILTNGGIAKLQAALISGTKVQVVKFGTGFTTGAVNASMTSVPGLNYGPVAVASAVQISTDSAQYDCIVPETAGNFTINTLGLFDQDDQLFAIGKMSDEYSKVANNLPTTLGNKLSLPAQIAVTNINATMSWTMNVLATSNLNFVNTPENLSGLAIIGQYKAYRVNTMPYGGSAVATTNGSFWSFTGLEVESSISTTSGISSSNTKLKGSAFLKFRQDHLLSIVEITSGPLAGQVRTIQAVDLVNNEITVNTPYASIPGSGISYVLHVKQGFIGFNTVSIGNAGGRLIGADGLSWNPTSRLLGVNFSFPTFGVDINGSGLRTKKFGVPSAPTITPQGTSGFSTYGYYLVYEDFAGRQTTPGPIGQTSSGNAFLSVSNYNRVNFPLVEGVRKVYVLKGSTSTRLGVVDLLLTPTVSYIDDTGQATTTFTPSSRDATGDAEIQGLLTINEAPTQNYHAANKLYVDAQKQLPTGTKMLFIQSTAPAGWTQDTSVNDRVIRVVSGASGGATGGSWTISGITITQAGAHTHSVANSGWGTTGGSLGSVGSGVLVVGSGLGEFQEALESLRSSSNYQATSTEADHLHLATHNGSWRPQYVDAIICTRQ